METQHQSDLLASLERDEADALHFEREHGRSLDRHLYHYSSLLSEAKRYRDQNPDLDTLLTSLEQQDWETVADVSGTAAGRQHQERIAAARQTKR